MRKISVVVPVFRRQCYIKGIIRQLEMCKKNIDTKVIIELILVNDAPDDKFYEEYQSESIEIRQFDSDRNRGIHGARVRGLEYSTGEYILFLDQDDRISLSYFKSQLSFIEEADAVVCQAINDNRLFYNNDMKFEEVVSFQSMISRGNRILSPGQVLLRKETISKIWKENILRNNGADDWLLWICMMNEGKVFALNNEILYEHVIDGHNCSGSTVKMYESEKEIIEIIKTNTNFTEECKKILANTITQNINVRLKELDRLKKCITLYDSWVKIIVNDESLEAYLIKRGYNNIGIYGVGKIGIQLYKQLNKRLNIICFIDRNAKYLNADIPIYTLNADIPKLDVVIMTMMENEEKIMRDISDKIHTPALCFGDICRDIVKTEINL